MKKKITSFMTALMLIMLMATSALASAQVTPLVEPEVEKDSLSPGQYNGWNYFIVPPGTSYSGVMYNGPTADLEYTREMDGEISHSSTDQNGFDTMSSTHTSDTYQSDDNPVYGDEERQPRVTRIRGDVPYSLSLESRQPVGLVADNQFTIFMEEDEFYYFSVNMTEMFFLDIDVADQNAGLSMYSNTLVFPSPACCRNTIPVYPVNSTVEEHFFSLVAWSASTLVTINMHVNNLDVLPIAMEVNTTYSGEFVQGETLFEEVDDREDNANNSYVFDFMEFNIGLEADGYYYLGVDFYEKYTSLDIFSICTYYTWRLIDVDMNLEYQGDGVYLATSDTNITILVYAMGPQLLNYDVVVRQQQGPPELPPNELELNKAVTLRENEYYEFSFTSPRVFAINSTDTSLWFQLYIYNDETESWDFVESGGYFSGHYFSNFGNLIESSFNKYWYYLPAGEYRILTLNLDGSEITFNAFAITDLSSARDYTINQDSLIVFQIPADMGKNNYFNITNTDTNATLEVRYQYDVIYVNTFGPSVYTSATQYIGINGDTNETKELNIFPVRQGVEPIIMFRPRDARNSSTLAAIDEYSTTIKLTPGKDSGPVPTTSLYGAIGEIYGFASQSSSTASYPINDDTVGSGDSQGIYLPISTTPNMVYNITVQMFGNTSSTTNVTINTFYFSSGRNYDSVIFWEGYSGTAGGDAGDFYYYLSQMVLTTASTSYLYLELDRIFSGGSYLNATMVVTLTVLNFPELFFDVTMYEDFVHNGIILDGFVAVSVFLLTYVGAFELLRTRGGFLPFSTPVAIVVAITSVALVRRRLRGR